MKSIGRKRLTLIAIAVFSALIGIAWFGDLSSALRINVSENGGGEPLLQPPAVAVALVERALEPYGGLPHDAHMTRFASEQATAVFPDGTTAPTTVEAFDPTYEPRDALLWKDRILGRVEAVTQQTCEDGGMLPPRYQPRNGPAPTCRRYVLSFPLRVTWLDRQWRPWIVRRVARWGQRAFAPAVPVPASISTTCPHPPDVGAIRRAVAAIDLADTAMSQIYDRAHTEPMWTMAAAQPGATVARWDPPYPTVPLNRRVTIVAAVVSDAPPRFVTVRFETPMGRPGRPGISVLTFHTTNDEPVCEPPARVPEPNLAQPAPSWQTIVATVRARADSEMRWRTAGHRVAGSSRIVSAERRPAESVIEIETYHPIEGHWRARFTVDERVPAIEAAEFVRTGG